MDLKNSIPVLTLTAPSLLFPAISLLFIAYNNRFHTLAALVRKLCSDFENNQDMSTYKQITYLKKRLKLIRAMQGFGLGAFLFCASSMLLIFSGMDLLAKSAFAIALILLLISLAVALHEIILSVNALEIVLSEVKAPKNNPK